MFVGNTEIQSVANRDEFDRDRILHEMLAILHATILEYIPQSLPPRCEHPIA